MKFNEFLLEKNIFENGYQNINPVVSVVMPTYCRMAEGLLKKCIDSVLRQSYTNFEFIIIDDGSSDGSQDLVLDYARKDTRIVYVRHDVNSGLPAVRTNEGIILARGEYIAFIFDDNVWEEDFLEVLMFEMNENPADVQYSITKMISGENTFFDLGGWPFSLEFLQHLNTIANGSVLCKRNLFEKIGLYDPHVCLRRVCDWDLWLRALKSGATFHFVEKALSTEYGPSSPVSLGLSVKMDYKITYAYMADEQHAQDRSKQLSFSTINEYDVFDESVILPYIINYGEFVSFEEMTYKPFFETHPYYSYCRKLNNRWFDTKTNLMISPFSGGREFAKKKRILLICNTYNNAIEQFVYEIKSKNPNAIILTCGEWQFSAYFPQDIDVLFLADCTSGFMKSFLIQYKDCGIPIVYLIIYGLNKKNILENPVDYNELTAIKNVFGFDLYFPNRNHVWNTMFKTCAESIMEISDIVVNMSDMESTGLLVSQKKIISYKDRKNTNILELYPLLSEIKQKKCLIFLNSELFSGSEVYGVMIAYILKNIGMDVEICIPENDTYHHHGMNELDAYILIRGLPPLTRAPYKPGGAFIQTINNELIQWIENKDAGLIICSTVITDILMISSHIKAHSVFAVFQPTGYAEKNIQMLKTCVSGIISDSQWSSDQWNDALQLDCIKIPSILDLENFKPYKANESGEFNIAIGGTLQPRKRQLEAIKACHLLIQKGYSIQLNIYGYMLAMMETYIDEIRDYIKTNDLAGRVNLCDLVDLDDIIEKNDIILSTSVDESLPQTLLLSMAGGMIAVACPSGGIEEVVIDHHTGYLASGFDIPDIYDVLEKAIVDKENWGALVENAQKLLRKEYSFEHVSNILVSHLTKITRHHKLLINNSNQNLICSTQQNQYANTPIPEDVLCYSGHIPRKREYKVICTKYGFSKLGIIFDSQSKTGSVSIHLYAGGRVIRSGKLSINQINPSGWTYFQFHPVHATQGAIFIIELLFEDLDGNIGVYEDITKRSFIYKVMNKLKRPLKGNNTLLVDFWEERK